MLVEVAYRVTWLEAMYGAGPNLGNETELRFHYEWQWREDNSPQQAQPATEERQQA